MTITFTIPKKESWRRHWRHWVRFPLRLALRLSALPVLVATVCKAVGFGLALSTITIVVVCILPFAAFLLAGVDLVRKITAWRREADQERIAEIGKFDFRWGTPSKAGYYYHWSSIKDIQDMAGVLFFCLNNGNTLQVPKEAFPHSGEAERFFEEARNRWEKAKMNEKHYSYAQDTTVWPPPPRVEA